MAACIHFLVKFLKKQNLFTGAKDFDKKPKVIGNMYILYKICPLFMKRYVALRTLCMGSSAKFYFIEGSRPTGVTFNENESKSKKRTVPSEIRTH